MRIFFQQDLTLLPQRRLRILRFAPWTIVNGPLVVTWNLLPQVPIYARPLSTSGYKKSLQPSMMQSLKPWQNDVNRALPNRFQEKRRIICLFSTKVFCLTFWSAVSRNQFGDVDPKRAKSLKKKKQTGRGLKCAFFPIPWTYFPSFPSDRIPGSLQGLGNVNHPTGHPG